MRGHFMWRIGCFFLFMVFLIVSVVALLTWLISGSDGWLARWRRSC